MDEEKDELREKIREAEQSLLVASYEKAKAEEMEKMRTKQDGPPKLTGVKRSKLSNNDKARIITEYGIDTYNELPL